MVLIAYPPSRPFLFPIIPPPPGQPLSATDPTNQRGDESAMDVVHPQLHRSKAEQIEEQSYEFTKSIEKFGLRVLSVRFPALPFLPSSLLPLLPDSVR
jgi:hypothetical protein